MSVSSPPEQHVLLHGISWPTYESMLRDLRDRPIRLTFDRGDLEIMSPTSRHERLKKHLGRLIEAMTDELGVAVACGGSTTWRRRDLQKGLEPDECYWVQNEARVRDKQAIDLRVDPPPDLAVEIEVFASALGRMGIYASLGVPEVWRHDGERLTIHLLGEDGAYRESPTSGCFPWLLVEPFSRHLNRAGETDETSWIRQFRVWVRQELATA